MAITATTTTASTIRITIGFLLRAGPHGARRAARLNVVEMALVAGLGGSGNLKGKGGGNIDVLFAIPAVPAQLRGRPMTPDRRTGRAPRPALDEHGIAELVRAVPTGLQLPVGPAERGLVRERAQQFVMAAAGFVRAREDGVDDAQPAGRADALGHHALARAHHGVARRCLFQRAHDRRADRDDASTRRMPGTREYLACEAGTIVLAAAGERWTLRAGDVVVFRGDQRHSYANPGTVIAVGYSVVLLVPVS